MSVVIQGVRIPVTQYNVNWLRDLILTTLELDK